SEPDPGLAADTAGPRHIDGGHGMPGTFITTTIPYVNSAPHLGFALEVVQADVLARHHRRHGRPTRFQSGTDDNSLKNVLAAEAAGCDVRTLVDTFAARF